MPRNAIATDVADFVLPIRAVDRSMVRYRAKRLDDAALRARHDRIGAYDLIVALSPAAMRAAQEYTRWHAIEVEYWPIFDPTGLGETRAEKLAAYRQTRDQIERRIRERFGPPEDEPAATA